MKLSNIRLRAQKSDFERAEIAKDKTGVEIKESEL